MTAALSRMLGTIVIVPAVGAALYAASPEAEALFSKARDAQVAGQLSEAEALYRTYLKQHGPRAEIVANLGALLARRESYDEAIARYKEALKLDPSLAPLHLNLGLAYLKRGRPSDAAAEFDVFLKAQPDHRQARQLRAMAFLESERYKDAETEYRALLTNGDPTLVLGLSTSLLRQGKVEEARRAFEPLLADGSASSQLVLGQLLAEENRLDDALAALEQARSLNPALPNLRLSLGSVLWRLRRTGEALDEWRADYRERPDSFEVLYTLGSALSTNAAAIAEAESLLRKAVSIRSGNARANYQLAKLVWQKSKSPEALEFLQRSTRADPEFREAFFLQATVLKSLGRNAEASKSFARVKQLSEKELARQQDLFTEVR